MNGNTIKKIVLSLAVIFFTGIPSVEFLTPGSFNEKMNCVAAESAGWLAKGIGFPEKDFIAEGNTVYIAPNKSFTFRYDDIVLKGTWLSLIILAASLWIERKNVKICGITLAWFVGFIAFCVAFIVRNFIFILIVYKTDYRFTPLCLPDAISRMILIFLPYAITFGLLDISKAKGWLRK